MGLLAARGVAGADELRSFLAPAAEGLHDPLLLPDAEAALRRLAAARERGERVLVYGDFDADGLAGLAILTIALRRLGTGRRTLRSGTVERRAWAVTAGDRPGSGRGPDAHRHRGLRHEQRGRRSSRRAGAGSTVLVTDHHHASSWPSGAVAVVNPQRSDSRYPERRLTGAGVAWKLAQALLVDEPAARPDGAMRGRRSGGSGGHRHRGRRGADPGREPRHCPIGAGCAAPRLAGRVWWPCWPGLASARIAWIWTPLGSPWLRG